MMEGSLATPSALLKRSEDRGSTAQQGTNRHRYFSRDADSKYSYSYRDVIAL